MRRFRGWLILAPLTWGSSGCEGPPAKESATPAAQTAVSESPVAIQNRLQGRWKVVSVQANDSATASALKSGDFEMQ